MITDHRVPLFTCDPVAAADHYRARGFAAWSGGVSGPFLAAARPQVDALREHLESQARPSYVERDFALPGAEHHDELLAFTAALTGTPPGSWILAECQLKGYGFGVSADPSLHKDRSASELAIGVPLWVPGASAIVLYPEHCRDANPFPSAREYGTRLTLGQRPEVALLGASPRRIASAVGDVVAFPGSSMFHGRERPAGVVALYFKLNRMGLDPLGADPRTYAARRASLALADGEDPALAELDVTPCPLLTKVIRERCRLDGWHSLEIGQIAGHKDLLLSEHELSIVLHVVSPTRVAALLAHLRIEVAAGLAMIRRLVRGGGLDLREHPRSEPA